MARPLLSSGYMFALTLLEISMATFLIGACFYRFQLVLGIFSAVLYFGLINVVSLLVLSLNSMEESVMVLMNPETFQPGAATLKWVLILLFAVTGWLVYRRTDVRM